jgi:plastocyanin
MKNLRLIAIVFALFALTGCAVTLTEPTASNSTVPAADQTVTHVHGLTEMAATDVPQETVVAEGKTANVEIKLFSFQPAELQVTVGTTVTWTNNDDIEHSVTQGTPPDFGGLFNSDFFTKGQTFSFTFNDIGEFAYFCMRHNSMTGKIIVVAQ